LHNASEKIEVSTVVLDLLDALPRNRLKSVLGDDVLFHKLNLLIRDPLCILLRGT
jgi:hypothetical protein